MIQMRPRSSKVMATGLTMSGSLATSSTANPAGTVILAMASDGESGGPGRAVLGVGDGRVALGEGRPARQQAPDQGQGRDPDGSTDHRRRLRREGRAGAKATGPGADQSSRPPRRAGCNPVARTGGLIRIDANDAAR